MNWSSIPTMFSNVIGQILPGLAILILFFASIMGPRGMFFALLDPNMQAKVFSLGPIITMLVVSQVLGMLIGQLWSSTLGRTLKKRDDSIIEKELEQRLTEHNCMLTALKHDRLAMDVQSFPELFVMHDHLHLSAPDQAMRLLKIRAERRHCHALTMGAAILALVHIRFLIGDHSLERMIWEIALISVALASFFRAQRLVGFQANGIAAIWLSLASAGKLAFQMPEPVSTADAKAKHAGK